MTSRRPRSTPIRLPAEFDRRRGRAPQRRRPRDRSCGRAASPSSRTASSRSSARAGADPTRSPAGSARDLSSVRDASGAIRQVSSSRHWSTPHREVSTRPNLKSGAWTAANRSKHTPSTASKSGMGDGQPGLEPGIAGFGDRTLVDASPGLEPKNRPQISRGMSWGMKRRRKSGGRPTRARMPPDNCRARHRPRA